MVLKWPKVTSRCGSERGFFFSFPLLGFTIPCLSCFRANFVVGPFMMSCFIYLIKAKHLLVSMDWISAMVVALHLTRDSPNYLTHKPLQKVVTIILSSRS
ncbi:hypothetical protein AAZV13_16G103800 [Glycine max]